MLGYVVWFYFCRGTVSFNFKAGFRNDISVVVYQKASDGLLQNGCLTMHLDSLLT